MARAIAPEQVLAEVERVMSKPFAWGACDCCSAACDVFTRLWGVDPMASIRGYRGAMAAHRVAQPPCFSVAWRRFSLSSLRAISDAIRSSRVDNRRIAWQPRRRKWPGLRIGWRR